MQQRLPIALAAPPGLYPEPETGHQRDWTRSTWADQDKREAKHRGGRGEEPAVG